jgi:TatD DNase family protein
MKFIDTHTHLFLEHFNDDIDAVIKTAIEKGVEKFFLPNIDSESINDVLELKKKYPDNCFPLSGLHPTSVNENFVQELEMVEKLLSEHKFYGIGETGMDLYWDKTFIKEQEEAFAFQLELAKKHKLPIIIHVRDSFDEVFKVVDAHNNESLTGIFHCFTGDYTQAQKIIEYGGFKLGIGGVITFKNSKLGETIEKIPLEHIVLETDSPYLAPTPHRGKRNESSYIPIIAEKVADLYKISVEEVAEVTTNNASAIFKLNS